MKTKKFKQIMAGFFALAVVVMSSMTALAADTVDVEGSGKYASDTEIIVGFEDKDLFSNMKNVMPGSSLSNTANISNKSDRAVTLYMKAFPEFAELMKIRKRSAVIRERAKHHLPERPFAEDILNKVDMTLSLGDEIIYKGSADGKTPDAGFEAMTAGDYGINLGSFASGSKKALKIDLHFPGEEFDNSYANTFDAVDWVFYAEGTTPSEGGNNGGGGGSNGGGDGSKPRPIIPTEPTPEPQPSFPSVLPKLGDAGVSGYIFGILFAMLIVSSALYLKRRMNRKQ